jgi:hypothetical protein
MRNVPAMRNVKDHDQAARIRRTDVAERQLRHHSRRYPVGTDFAASPLNRNFRNNERCGNPKELPEGKFGVSATPDSTSGTRGKPTGL